MRGRRRLVAAGVLVAVLVPAARTGVLGRTAGAMARPAPAAIAVRGNRLAGAGGTPVTLIGASRSGTEYACAQGWGIFDGPSSKASIEAMRSWGMNTVRVPLNEDCWLGVNVPPTYAGAAYRRTITAYVARIESAGMYVILDLHWGAPGTTPALSQEPMPDASHAVAFWTSVAATFRTDRGVLFEAFNEPHGVSWACWRDGCAMPGGWRAVGMQTLVDAIRSAGASQPIILDGLQWANDLVGWLRHRPADPRHELVAGFHVYPWNDCAIASCWRSEVGPLAAKVPVVTTEVGQKNCNGGFVRDYLAWATRTGVSSLAWAWDTNEGCLALVQDYSGVPSRYGTFVRSGFRALAVKARVDPAGLRRSESGRARS